MAFDASKPYGTALGGKTHGCAVQDGKIYRHDGTELDELGAVIKKAPAAPKQVAPPAPPAPTAELPAQVSAQIAQS